MTILRDSKKSKMREEEYDVPPDINTGVSYAELMLLIDKKALNGGNTLFGYKSGGEAMKITACPLKGVFTFPNSGIEIKVPSGETYFVVVASKMKQISYFEKHFINGGKPLTSVAVDISLKDGGHVDFSYQVVGHWIEDNGVRKKIQG